MSQPLRGSGGVNVKPSLMPPFSICFRRLQEGQGESSESRLSQKQKFFN